jgi:hypothetical protein
VLPELPHNPVDPPVVAGFPNKPPPTVDPNVPVPVVVGATAQKLPCAPLAKELDPTPVPMLVLPNKPPPVVPVPVIVLLVAGLLTFANKPPFG